MEQLIFLDTNRLQPFVDSPESIITQEIKLQISIASYPDTPRNLLEILATSEIPEVAEAAQLHINYAGELSGNWQNVIDDKLKTRYLGQNDRLAVELLKIAPVPAYFLSEFVPANYLIQGLSNPYLPLRYRLQLLERLAQEPSLEPRLQVAESLDTPVEVLQQLIGDLELAIRIAVQYNPNCPPELVKLVTGQHEVASNWDTDSQQLDNLSHSNWDWIRLAVAQNPSTSEETLLQLAEDKVFKIQLAVAKNPATSAKILAILAEHSSKIIQAVVAKHLNATEEILRYLFDIKQIVIKSRENLPASIIEKIFNKSPKEPETPLFLLEHGGFLGFFVRQKNTPTWILAEFANIDLEELKIYVENNYKKSPTVQDIEGWIGDRCNNMIELAKHPQVSREILEILANFPNHKVQLAVAINQKTHEKIRLQLLEELATNYNYKIKTEVAKNLNTPLSILKKMAQNEFYQTKLIQEIRRVFASEYPENSRSYKTIYDRTMSDFKYKILRPANISLDVDQWVEAVVNSEIWDIMMDNSASAKTHYSSFHQSVDQIMPQLIAQWSNLLPQSSKKEVKWILFNIKGILGMIKDFLQNHQFMRSVAVALVGNPNTPSDLREQLKNQLIRPNISLEHRNSDFDVITALAYNTAIPEAERKEYFQQLLSLRNKKSLAINSNTPPEILLQIMSNPGTARQAVSRNPNAPHRALAELAKDDNNSTRNWVAENPGTPSHILMQLARDSDDCVRYNVLKNPNLSLLNRYQILLEEEERKEGEKSNKILVKRTDSPYALARVLETGDQKVKISAARNRKTPIQVLEKLAKHEDETVRQIMAQNQNLPLNTLMKLAEDQEIKVRQAILSNPNVSLNILIKLAQDSSDKIRLSLAQMLKQSAHSIYKPKEVPVQLLEILARDEKKDIRATVASNPKSPASLLTQLAKDAYAEVRFAIAKNPNTPVIILETLDLSVSPDTPRHGLQSLNQVLVNRYKMIFYRNFVSNPSASARLLDKILEDTNDDKILTEIAKHPNTNISTLERFVNHSASVRYGLIKNPNITVNIIKKLANDSYIPIIRSIAQNQKTPSEVLEELANNTDFTTRLSIVRHPNTPPRVLAQIVEDAQISKNKPNRTKDTLKSAVFGDAYDLLKAIAANPKTPTHALEIIARREFVSPAPDPKSILPLRTDDDVIKSLVYNPSLTPELINILTQDPCVEVRVALTRHPNLTEALWLKIAEDKEVFVRKAIASQANTPISILETLARDIETDVRVATAGNNNTSSQILAQLSQDAEAVVRTKVAANSNTPNNILENLAPDESIEVRRALTNNLNTSESIRNSLQDLLPVAQTKTQSRSPTLRGLSRIYNPNTDDLSTLLSEYIKSDVPLVRFVSLLHPLTPVEILANSANSISWIERYAVADNPATPTEIKQQLAQDSNQIVRAVAMDNLVA